MSHWGMYTKENTNAKHMQINKDKGTQYRFTNDYLTWAQSVQTPIVKKDILLKVDTFLITLCLRAFWCWAGSTVVYSLKLQATKHVLNKENLSVQLIVIMFCEVFDQSNTFNVKHKSVKVLTHPGNGTPPKKQSKLQQGQLDL